MNRACFAVASVLWLASAPSAEDAGAPTVSLRLVRAEATQYMIQELRDDKRAPVLETRFDCQVTANNATGNDLAITTSFASPFDGMDLVVTTEDGRVLAQQPYIAHQSPFAPSRVVPLKQGETNAELRFPVRYLPKDAKTFKVRLVGTLPGSDYKRVLSTETVKVDVK